MVNLCPQEVPRVLNMFPRELIESTPQDFPQANPLLHLRVCIQKILWGTFNQLPREQIENSRDFPREQIHHTLVFSTDCTISIFAWVDFFLVIFDHFWHFFSPLLGMLQKKYSSKNSLAANFQNNGAIYFTPTNDKSTGVFRRFSTYSIRKALLKQSLNP